MKQIEVNYKSDFSAILALEGGWGVPFKAKFWTSTPSRAFIASWDGGENYCHCHRDPDGRMCFGFDSHNMGTGKLMLELTFYIDNTCFADGICSEVIAPFSPTFVDESGEEYIVTLGFKGMDTLTVVGTFPAFFNKGEKGDKGDPGESAYEVAVRNGFEGTEDEWLASLHGKDGVLTPEQEQLLNNSVQVINLDELVADGKFVCASEFVVRLNGVVTQEHRIMEAARFELFETAGNIRVYIILMKDESVENGWTWIGCISTEGSGKLYDRNLEEVEKIGGGSYAEWRVYLDIVFPPVVVDAYTKDESDAKFQPKGSYATSEELKNLETELGEFENLDFEAENIVDAVNKAYNHGGGSWGNARYENGTLFLNGAKVENDKIIL